MNRNHRVLVAVLLMTISSNLVPAQEQPLRDSTYIFTPSSPELVQKTNYEPLRNAWGVDILISNNGFGAGAFYRREFSDVLSGFATFAISDVKDDSEVEFYNYYTGQSFVPGKVNRMLLMPLVIGAQYRLFKDDIVDNFRPYISVGVGPSMVFVAPYSKSQQFTGPNGEILTTTEQIEFFSSLKYGKANYTLGGYIGAGAYFGLDKSTLSGISIRYYVVPFRKGIESLDKVFIKQFGGFFITLNFGSFY
ncbi:MAG: hypothetical protein HYZ01_12630 [Ignavibacteriales bacterium]|nr:hypothetical protein [Ignavibacteriales bacterium]